MKKNSQEVILYLKFSENDFILNVKRFRENKLILIIIFYLCKHE